MKINTPILLIGFNRPEIIKQSFARIKEVRPKKLYIAIDGPRCEVENEKELVNQVKNEVSHVDWDCDVHYKYNESNKGAEVTVSSAISWVLEKEKYVIIIEDDVVPSVSFFHFAEEMLLRYLDNEQIATVTSNNITPLDNIEKSDYYFAKYGHSWGWATWKRFWDKFDLNIEIKEDHLSTDFLKTICNSDKEVNYYKNMFTRMKKKGRGNNTWDVIGLYIARVNNMLSIIPRVNLSTNIGEYGLHARGKTDVHFLKYEDNFKVKKHPKKIQCFVEYDINHFEKYIYKKKKSIFLKIKKKLKKKFKGN